MCPTMDLTVSSRVFMLLFCIIAGVTQVENKALYFQTVKCTFATATFKTHYLRVNLIRKHILNPFNAGSDLPTSHFIPDFL